VTRVQKALIAMISAYAPLAGIAITVINIYYPILSGPITSVGAATLIILGTLLGIATYTSREKDAKPTQND
jgi:hypothetical protein